LVNRGVIIIHFIKSKHEKSEIHVVASKHIPDLVPIKEALSDSKHSTLVAIHQA